jgi:outer membrane protein assembly factor BamE (lipoprotein component of BamABCDE complex)
MRGATLRALAGLLSLWAGGCVMIPTFESAQGKPDVRRLVGNASSAKPIRPGATREHVAALLGRPQSLSDDGRVADYVHVMTRGYAIILPPLYPAAGPITYRMYYLRLAFDAGNVLEQYELRRDRQSSDAGFGYSLPEPRATDVGGRDTVLVSRAIHGRK